MQEAKTHANLILLENEAKDMHKNKYPVDLETVRVKTGHVL